MDYYIIAGTIYDKGTKNYKVLIWRNHYVTALILLQQGSGSEEVVAELTKHEIVTIFVRLNDFFTAVIANLPNTVMALCLETSKDKG